MDNPTTIEVVSRKDDIKRRVFSSNKTSGQSAPAKTVAMADIEVGSRIIPVDPMVVALIKGSILRTGRLLTPIIVRQIGAKYRLIDGVNRYMAFEHLGRSQIEVYVVEPVDDDEAKAYEAIANCHRRPKLSALDRALNDAAYVKYVKQKVPQDAGPRGGHQPKEQFQKKTADELGVKPDQIRRSLQIAKITPYVQDQIRKHGLEGNQSVLLQIAASGDHEVPQVATLARLLRGIGTGPSRHRHGAAVEASNGSRVQKEHAEEDGNPSLVSQSGLSGDRTAVPCPHAAQPGGVVVVGRDESELEPPPRAAVLPEDNRSEQLKIIECLWKEAQLLRQALYAATEVERRRFFDDYVLPELFGPNARVSTFE